MGLKANFSHEVGPAGRFLLGQSLRSQVMRDMFASDLYNHCIYYIQFSLILLTSPFQRELVFDVFKRSAGKLYCIVEREDRFCTTLNWAMFLDLATIKLIHTSCSI